MRKGLLYLFFLLIIFVVCISLVIAADPPTFDNEQFYGSVAWAKSAVAPTSVSVKVIYTGKVYTSTIKNINCDSKQCIGKYGYDKDNILRVQASEGEELAFSIGVTEVKKVNYKGGDIIQLNLPEGGVAGINTGSEAGNQTSSQGNQTSSGTDAGQSSSSSSEGIDTQQRNVCSAEWKCNDWGYCGSDMKQTRICADLKGCEASKMESRKCDKCDESWTCSVWTSCLNGQQVRTCVDEHKCGTSLKKPNEERSCVAIGEEQQQVNQYTPEETQGYEPEEQQPKPEVSAKPVVKKSKFNLSYVIYGVVGLVVLIGLIIGGYLFIKSRGGGDQGTFDELESVYRTMESRGLSDTVITSKLIEKGWNESLVRKFLKKR